MSSESEKAFNEVLAGFSPAVQTVAGEARALIYALLPPVVEVVWAKQKTIGYGTGPKKMSEHFCWLAPYNKHVVLGFNYGAELPDPTHILEGTGKLFRHVRLETVADVRQPAVEALIKVATTHRVPPPKG